MKMRLTQVLRVCGKSNIYILKSFRGQFPAWIFPSIHHIHTFRLNIKPNNRDLFGKFQRNGQSYIAQANYRYNGFFIDDFLVHGLTIYDLWFMVCYDFLAFIKSKSMAEILLPFSSCHASYSFEIYPIRSAKIICVNSAE